MEICAEDIVDTKYHQQRNFEENGNTERINDNNIPKATVLRVIGKERCIGKPIHDWYDEWEKRKRPLMEKQRM